jgi:predicted pyridoxine 5'-phosphate oxidase superfamily flavin-nucleotide-binding protein
VYALCPKYIQARRPAPALDRPRQACRSVCSDRLDDDARAWIERCDTFFIGSAHPQRGPDAAHRGGSPGFVAVCDEHTLRFPDYQGNSMFNTLGNLTVHPRAGLLLLDFEHGDVLQLTVRARVLWADADRAAFPGAQRVVELTVEQAVRRDDAVAVRWTFLGASRLNPPARRAIGL